MDVDVRWVPAGVGGCAPAAESCGREIERSPEELDGAGLSEEPRAEALEDNEDVSNVAANFDIPAEEMEAAG